MRLMRTKHCLLLAVVMLSGVATFLSPAAESPVVKTLLTKIAFTLPDGGTSPVAFNKSTQPQPIQVACDSRWFEFHLPARSMVTYLR
jgi:hypothetical protein